MRRLAFLLCTVAAAAVSPLQAEPLRIATIEAFSGPTGEVGVLWAEGVRYAVQKANAAGGVNAEPVKLSEYDNLGTPGGASDKLRTAVADGARVVVSGGSSAIAAQLSEDVRKYNLRNVGKEVLYINLGSEAYEFSADKCHFWFFHLSTNPFVRMKALVATMKEQNALGQNVYSFNQNYSYGQEMQKAQAKYVADAGAKIVEATLHDINKIQDFSPYVAKIKASGADTVLTGNWGNDMVLLMKAAGNAGLAARFGNTNLDNPGVIGSAGEAALGAYFASPYNAEAGGAAGTEFAEDYKARMGHYPTFSATAAFGTQLLIEAARQAGATDKSADAKGIALALEKAKIDTPLGSLSVRAADHQAILPVAVATVSKDARFKADETAMGLKLVKVVAGSEAAVEVDAACKMQRPS